MQNFSLTLYSLSPQVASPQFSGEFGDVTLVLADGSLHYYRSLLALLSPWWSRLLQGAPLSSLVLLPGHSREQFVRELAGQGEEGGQGAEEGDEPEVKQDIVTQDEQTNDFEFILNNSLEVEETSTPSDSQLTVDAKDLPSLLVDSISPDFPWPPELSGPNYHRMRWREAKGSVLEVRGNLSLFSCLRQRFPSLPQSAAFSVRDTELVGKVSIQHLVDGQAFSHQPAFMVDARGPELSLDELLAGLETREWTDPYSLVNIYYSDTVASLHQLTNKWKMFLAANWGEGGRARGRMGTRRRWAVCWPG